MKRQCYYILEFLTMCITKVKKVWFPIKCWLFTGPPPHPEDGLEVWAKKEVQSMTNIRSPNNDILYIIFIYDTSLFLAIIININVKVRSCFTNMIQFWF